MTLADGDLFEVLMQQEFLEQKCLNVFGYRFVASGTGVTNTAAGVLAVIAPAIIAAVKVIQSDQVFYQLAQLTQLTGGDDYSELGLDDEAGAVTGEPLPPANAWTFRYLRASSNARNGYKRFAGISENHQNAGHANPAITTTLEGIASFLFERIETGIADDNYFVPVVIRRQRDGVPLDPIEFDYPGDVQFAGIGTQNTRKFGRGI